MNRHARRAARVRTTKIDPRKIDQTCDIQVDGKVEQIVMIFANPKGRKIVEDLWPDVQWTTDEIFASAHSSDWLFTHIRVTRLPPDLESEVPLAFASPDAIGCAVAITLQRRTEPRRVVSYSGSGADLKVNMFDGAHTKAGTDIALFAECVPADTKIDLKSESLH
jgi:hypothetical protein